MIHTDRNDKNIFRKIFKIYKPYYAFLATAQLALSRVGSAKIIIPSEKIVDNI